jgi:hypothetical protein
MIRPVGAAVGDERVEVRVHPDLKLTGWSPGDYRLTENAAGAEQGRVLTWVGSLLPAGVEAPFRRPPAVSVTTGDREFSTHEAVEWRAEDGYFVLVARVSVRVRRGPLFGLTVHTPPGFERRRVTAGTDDLIGYAGNTTAGPHGVVVEFVRPLGSGQQAELRFELRGPPLPVAVGRPVRVPFPRVVPVGAGERDGWVSLGPVHGWVTAADLTSGPAPAADPTRSDPPLPADSVTAFAFRGREPEGWITLNPIRPEFDAETVVRVRADGPRWSATTRFDLTVRSGSVASVVVFDPVQSSRDRSWTVADGSNAVASAVPIDVGAFEGANPLFGAASDPLAAVVQAGAAGELPWTHGTFWVVRFARPVTARVALESTQVVEVPEEEFAKTGRVEFRRLVLCGGGAGTPRVELDAALAARMVGDVGGDDGNAVDRWFPSRVIVSRRPAGPPQQLAPSQWAFAGLYVVTDVGEGATEVAFGGTVSGSPGSAFPVVLPAGAQVKSVAVDGRWVGPGSRAVREGEGGPVVRVLVPAGGAVPFEVRYRVPTEGNPWGRRVTSPLPELPGGPRDVRRWWLFRSGLLPGWPPRGWERMTADDLPAPADPTRPWPAGATAARFDGDSVVALPAARAVAAGLALAALILAVGWVGARRFPLITGFLLVVPVFGSGAVLLLGPPGWDRVAVAPLAAGLATFAAAAVRRGWPRPSVPVPPAVVAVVIACSLASFPSLAQPPGVETVLILPGPADAPDREVVIAPRALLDRLDAAAKLPDPVAVITSASYDGRVEDGTARLTARFTVESFRDGETTVALPLSDVRLESAAVDDKPAFPLATRPDLYSVAVVGRGRHVIDVRFAVPVTVAGPEREVRFGIPEVPDARLALAVPGGPEQVQASGRVGGQKVTSADGAVRLEAEIGGIRTVQARWRQAVGGAPEIAYREACVWDVSETEAELNACYLVKVEKGSVSQLRFALPADLEPSRVVVRPAEAAASPVLRDWKVEPAGADGFRPLVVTLLGPTDGRLVVTLECAPRRAPTRRPVLRFPRMTTPGAKPVQDGTYYAFRANRLAVEELAWPGATPSTADDLLFHFAGVAELKLDPGGPEMKVFRPNSPTARVELRSVLRPGAEPPSLTAETTWRVGPTRADVEGTVRWQTPQPVPAAEFDLPESRLLGGRVPRVVVTEVRGPDVAGWGQTGGRVQVWFRKPARDVTVEWVGRAALFGGDPITFEAATPRPVGGKLLADTVRVRTDADSAVEVGKVSGWKPAAANPGREWAFTTDHPAAPVLFRLFPPATTGPARGFGLVEASGGAVTYRATVEVPVRPGRPHRLVVSATGLSPQATAELDLPPGVTVSEQKATATGRTWVLDVPTSPAAVFRASVVVQFLSLGAAVRLPAVWAGAVESGSDPDGAVRWVGLVGRRPGVVLGGAAPAGLSDVRGNWPGEAERLRVTGGSVWAVPAGSAPPLLVFDRPAPAGSPPAGGPAVTPPPAGSNESATTQVRTTRVMNWPVVAWAGAAVVLFTLFVLLPRSTWPEQLGLAGGLFGAAVAGGWWIGLAVEAAARLVWLGRMIRR